MDLKLSFLFLLIIALCCANKGSDSWDCPCHLCRRILNFAVTILPSCPDPKALDLVFDANGLCGEASLADVTPDCIHFLEKFYLDDGKLRKELLRLQCFARTEKEVEKLCGHEYLACCNFLMNES